MKSMVALCSWKRSLRRSQLGNVWSGDWSWASWSTDSIFSQESSISSAKLPFSTVTMKPLESAALPPTKPIFSQRITDSAPASWAESAASAPAMPPPITRMSQVSAASSARAAGT